MSKPTPQHMQAEAQAQLPRGNRPGFLRQGLLIVLPVLALSAAGFLTLRQDLQLARHEAQDQAQALADQAATQLWDRLFAPADLDLYKSHRLELDPGGATASPPPRPAVPVPRPLDPSRLPAIAEAREFLATQPPADFAATTRLRLGQWLAEVGQAEEGMKEFQAIASTGSNFVSDSGTP